MAERRQAAIVREAGGLGDATQCLSVCRAYKAAGYEVTYFILDWYENYVRHSPDVDRVVGVGFRERRGRDQMLDPKRFPYLLSTGIEFDEVVDLWCPVNYYERVCPGPVDKDRMELWFRAASVPFAGLGRLQFSAEEEKLVEGTVRGLLDWKTADDYVIVVPYATGRDRSWPPSRWRKVIDGLRARRQNVITFVDKPSLKRQFPFPQLGKVPFWVVAAVVKRAKLVLSVDTGPLHMAGMMGVPTIGLFGCTDGELTCNPYPRAHWIQGRVCGPCYYTVRRGWSPRCRKVGCRSMLQIKPQQVLDYVDRVLKNLPAERRAVDRSGLAVCTIAYNEPTLMRRWLEYYYDKADELVVVYGRVSKYPRVENDVTPNIVSQFPDPEHKIQLVARKVWDSKAAMQNAWLDRSRCGVIAYPDIDEYIDDVEAIREVFERGGVSSATLPFQHYYRDTDHVVVGGRFDTQVMRVIRRQHGFRFRGRFDRYEGPGGAYHKANSTPLSVIVHHYGYAKPLSEMRAKHVFYCARDNGVHRDNPNWFADEYPNEPGEKTRVVPVGTWCPLPPFRVCKENIKKLV